MKVVVAIHKSGHSSNMEALLDQYLAALDKAREAHDALVRVGFNARDYDGPESFNAASEERELALRRLGETIEYLEAMTEAVSDQA